MEQDEDPDPHSGRRPRSNLRLRADGRRTGAPGHDAGISVSIALSSPSPGGGGSARIARCETGWGDGLSTRAPFETRDCHPTPPLISFASTLPLQGRVRKKLLLRSAP